MYFFCVVCFTTLTLLYFTLFGCSIMILACATNIRSGWKSIFSIFEVTAQEKTEIAAIAFGISEVC